jgi:hypothetical protein
MIKFCEQLYIFINNLIYIPFIYNILYAINGIGLFNLPAALRYPHAASDDAVSLTTYLLRSLPQRTLQ